MSNFSPVNAFFTLNFGHFPSSFDFERGVTIAFSVENPICIAQDGVHLKATFSVSPHFFNQCGIFMMPSILSCDKLSAETFGAHIFVIC